MLQYNEKKIGEFLDKFEGKEKENMRESINDLSQIINQPTIDMVKIMLNFNAAMEETAKELNQPDSMIIKGITTSFAASTISNLMDVFSLSEDDMTQLMKDVFEHMRNTTKNDNI